mmetsp:Transcript_8315/g.11656  ORF Transcript_8315/g.11656 Transcript_8315/m.11656 type:complete len:126 (-) Transcript_8315:73-450(-)
MCGMRSLGMLQPLAFALASVIFLDQKAGHALSACQDAPSMVDPWVRQHFDISLMAGTFYELAYHDYTQPRPICGCERSVKTVHADSTPPTILSPEGQPPCINLSSPCRSAASSIAVRVSLDLSLA